jgi:hypothetical protein
MSGDSPMALVAVVAAPNYGHCDDTGFISYFVA